MGESYETERGLHALNVSIAFTVIATVLVMARLYTRLVLVKSQGLDDLVIVNASIFDWAFFVMFVYEVKYGAGQHMATLPTNIIEKQLMFMWASIPLYQMTLFSSKISILLQYRRIFAIQKMRFACNILLVIVVIYATWTFISGWLNCVPVAKFWDSSVKGYCLSKTGLWFSNSGVHIASDLIILVLPMPVIKSLKLPQRQRIALMAIFALGGFVVVTTIIRLHSLLIISKSSDPTYDNVGAATWSAVECNVAIICACLPAIKPLVSKYLPTAFSSIATDSKAFTRSNGNRLPRSYIASHSITAGRDDQALYMYNINHRPSAECQGSSDNSRDNLGEVKAEEGIRVTTLLHQESILSDEASSTKGLVTKQ